MLRYVAFIWDPKDTSAAQAVVRLSETFRSDASPWTCFVACEGLQVFHRSGADGSDRAYPLPNGNGVVLGRLFRASDLTSAETCAEFDRLTARRILRTRGKSLVDDYWGRYVAFLRDHEARLHYVVRDPSGQMPCLWCPAGRVTLFFSDLVDVQPLAGSSLTIHWPSITAFLFNEGTRLRQAGFDQVTELFAGERLAISGQRPAPESIWKPATISTENVHCDSRSAAADLRSITEQCIQAWAGRSEHVLLSLSGGLDSAIVLGCLVRAPMRPRVTAVSRYTARPGEDERHYARAAASLAATELIECEWGGDGVSLDRLVEMAPTIERPAVQILSALDLGPRRRIAETCGASTLWSGQGGDHLFFEMRTDLFVADRLRRCGLRCGGLVRTMNDAARLTRKSYASVLWTVLSESLRRSSQVLTSREPSGTFLSATARADAARDPFTHSWTYEATDLPPGKRLQVSGLVDLVHRRSPCSLLDATPDFHPLISQPLIETCLRIPTDLLLYQGRTRGLAREAFRDRLPREILERDSKGTITSYYVRIIRENAGEIWKLLRDGVLASEHLLDLAKLERCLVHGQPLRPFQLYPLLACVTGEIWLRQAASLHQ